MTHGGDGYNSIGVHAQLVELVKMEMTLRKHFVYNDDIDKCKGNPKVLRALDEEIRRIETLEKKLGFFRNNLR